MFEHDISCQIMCSTEILINFDVNIPFLPYQNQNASYLCKKTIKAYHELLIGFMGFISCYIYTKNQ